MRITRTKFCAVSSRLARSMPDLLKWPFLGCFQDDRPENSRRLLVCLVGATPSLKTGMPNAHHGKQVLCRFEPSSPFYG